MEFSYNTSYSVLCHGNTSWPTIAAPPTISSKFSLNIDKNSKKRIDFSLVLELFRYHLPINTIIIRNAVIWKSKKYFAEGEFKAKVEICYRPRV